MPHSEWLTAKHDGLVLDAKTGRPVAGATILLQSTRDKPLTTSTTSDADGRFTIGPITETAYIYPLWLLPAEGLLCGDWITVEHPDYKAIVIPFSVFKPLTSRSCYGEGKSHVVNLEKAQL
jgi:hypothetical protein